jgi:hypothetical protein
MGGVTFTLADNWDKYWKFNPKDGYFYYISALDPEKSTETLLANVSISAEDYKKLDTDEVTLNVDILADSIQTKADALSERWKNSGVTINADGKLTVPTATAD